VWRVPIFLFWIVRMDVRLRYRIFCWVSRWLDWLIQRDLINMNFYVRRRFHDPRAMLRVRQVMALHWWIGLQIRHPMLRRDWTKEA
jgi:hypothetical protein